VAIIVQKIDAIMRHQQPPATCALVRPRTKPCDIVVCNRSALEVKQNKNMLMALVALAAEFDGVGGYSLPPGDPLWGGDSRTLSNKRPILQMDAAARSPSTQPSPTGGGDPLRRIKLTDATDQGVPSFQPSQRANQLQSCEEIAGGLS
jgi:hypothetical protein